MRLFGRRRPKYVGVAFRDLKNARYPISPGEFFYVFQWTLSSDPELGTWVYVPGSSGQATGVVVDLAAAPDGKHQLKQVISLVPYPLVEAAKEA